MNQQELQQYYARQAAIINEQIRLQQERAKYEALYYNYSIGSMWTEDPLCQNSYVENNYICDYFE